MSNKSKTCQGLKKNKTKKTAQKVQLFSFYKTLNISVDSHRTKHSDRVERKNKVQVTLKGEGQLHKNSG